MAQYQTFPGASGDSHSLDKLKALRLPSLYEKTFLDVGCNEGFFCGYAKFDGASRVIGLDQSAAFIARARQRFPACEFLQQGLDQLPAGPFDVILLASSLHNADDQPALITKLMDRLSTDGTLVLELGIVSTGGNKWVKVKRGIDERFFPTLSKLKDTLASYAWKHLGPSVSQQGDPARRLVVHVRRRRPVAYLLMQPSAYGKSSICRSLFKLAGIRVVSGDQTLDAVAKGKLAAPNELCEAIRRDFSRVNIYQTIHHVFSSGLAPGLVKIWVQHAGEGDFALDAFVPAEYRAEVSRMIADEGFMPVTLIWDQVGEPPPSTYAAVERAEAYFSAMAERVNGPGVTPPTTKLPFKGTTGFVDRITVEHEQLTIRGWALHETGTMPSMFRINLHDRVIDIDTFEKKLRPDVQKYFGLEHALCGYVITVPVPGVRKLNDVMRDLLVFGGNAVDQLDGLFHHAQT